MPASRSVPGLMAAQPADPARPRGGEPVSDPLRRVRTRAVVSLVALLVVATAISLAVLRQILLERTADDVKAALVARTEATAALAESSPGGGLARAFDRYVSEQATPADQALVAFIDGEAYAVSPGASPELAQAVAALADTGEEREGELETPVGDARFAARPLSAGGERGVIAAVGLLADERAEVEDAVQLGAAVALVVISLSALFMWLAVGRTLQPLRGLARTTRAISEVDLSKRVEVTGSDEVAELARTFNEMLDRLELAFSEQRQFLADVGHELRTPITVISGYLDTLGDEPDERARGAAVIAEELERMARLVDDLLLLARADRPGFLRREPVDLDLLTQDVFAKARMLGPRNWVLEHTGVGIVHVDPHRLTSAVMNLAHNALRHTHGNQLIAIGSDLAGEEARIWVRDEGAGIAAAHQDRIFERGERGEEEGGPGAGLGLAIVRAVAEAHGGRVELESAPGAGARFEIIVPAVEQPAE